MFPVDAQDWAFALLWFVMVFYNLGFASYLTRADAFDTRRIYSFLRCKIPGAPPAWLFAPVWLVLYVLMAYGGWLLFRNTSYRLNSPGSYNSTVLLMVLAILFTKLWTPLFNAGEFGFALADAIALWGVTLAAVWHLGRDMGSYGLEVPFAFYLALLVWVTYAVYLNAMALRSQRCVTRIIHAYRCCRAAEDKACIDAGLAAAKGSV